MIHYTCANCRRDLEVDDALAGSRVKCPHCANVEVIAATARTSTPAPLRSAHDTRSASAASPNTDDRAAAMGLPPDTGPETEVKRIHPVMFRSRPSHSLGIFALILGGLSVALAAHAGAIGGASWLAYPGWLAVLVGLGWVGWWKLDAMSTEVIITNKRTTVRRGLFSRMTREILHDQVKDIEVVQTFAQRLLRTGTLGIDGSGTDKIELIVEHLPDPVGLRAIVDAYREIG
ncbi:MAG: PH domain-containing protein [Phycisphaerales bacterium]|nr:PH domain-containing protein [Phycisphaerales bacterium]